MLGRAYKILSGLAVTPILMACAHSGASIEALDLAVQELASAPEQVTLSTRQIAIIQQDGLDFRDLNRNGVLDPYEDWRLTSGERAIDLVSRMTLEEKAGQLIHANIFPGDAQRKEYNHAVYEANIANDYITAFIPFLSLSIEEHARQNNLVQAAAEKGRLGIPATISTDPRNHFMTLVGASYSGVGYSSWPEQLGFAALNEPELMYQFAKTASAEYRATGFNQALSPVVDMATEPRWPRIYNTFGEDPEIAARLTAAYIRGFQGGDKGVERGHVPAVVKHWVGYGAAKNGLDSHNYYGRISDLQDEDLATHLKPFVSAFDLSVSGVMPAFSIFENLSVDGELVEQVGAAYSKVMITDLLRGKYAYDGVVLSDWSILKDCNAVCKNGVEPGETANFFTDMSTGWGVQDLSVPQRVALAMSVGVDQFGGHNETGSVIEAVRRGILSEERVDQSVFRILRNTISTGIFENPFVNEQAVSDVVNPPEIAALALKTQSRAMVLLQRDRPGALLSDDDGTLYIMNGQAEPFVDAGYRVAENFADAKTAIVRLNTPFETLHPNYLFGAHQHEGRLDFAPQSDEIVALQAMKKAGLRIVVDVTMDRPAILTNILPLADAVIVNFGANDRALLRALDGSVPPEGRLPIELPSSMEGVEAQSSGKPADSGDPLFPIGYRAE